MIDCIEAVVAPHSFSAYVKPTALVFTVEGGEIVLHVVRGREDALALLAAKRAQTRDERYRMSVKVVETSILPERADAPMAAVHGQAAGRLMDFAFEALQHFETLESLVFSEALGLDAFVMPKSYEIVSGFGVVRTPSGPLLETFHTRRQAADFLKRHEAHITEAEMEDADDEFGYSPIAHASPHAPEAFGGFAAALIGARFRLARIVNRKMRGLDP
ncbi:MAG TPA: hypothetical protein VL283_01250 [Candidatus Baltobacteraceae bacterium]|nr:hypothetical protein [Candidatus Baltobacteraceae bacterium]